MDESIDIVMDLLNESILRQAINSTILAVEVRHAEHLESLLNTCLIKFFTLPFRCYQSLKLLKNLLSYRLITILKDE